MIDQPGVVMKLALESWGVMNWLLDNLQAWKKACSGCLKVERSFELSTKPRNGVLQMVHTLGCGTIMPVTITGTIMSATVVHYGA